MYKRNSIKKLGRTHSHRKALIQNQLRSILKSGSVNTSSVKAKVLRGELESVFNKVRLSKDGDLVLTRELHKIFGDDSLVKKVFEIGKKEGSKITVKKIGFRAGDNTEISKVEITGFKVKPKSKKKGEDSKESKEVKKEIEKVVVKEPEEKKGILNLGRKSVSKKVEPMKRERARTRSGL